MTSDEVPEAKMIVGKMKLPLYKLIVDEESED
jgi:hypothetical protein